MRALLLAGLLGLGCSRGDDADMAIGPDMAACVSSGPQYDYDCNPHCPVLMLSGLPHYPACSIEGERCRYFEYVLTCTGGQWICGPCAGGQYPPADLTSPVGDLLGDAAAAE